MVQALKALPPDDSSEGMTVTGILHFTPTLTLQLHAAANEVQWEGSCRRHQASNAARCQTHAHLHCNTVQVTLPCRTFQQELQSRHTSCATLLSTTWTPLRTHALMTTMLTACCLEQRGNVTHASYTRHLSRVTLLQATQ